MISKERLEELIKEKKSIYWKFAKIKPSSWSEYTFMGNTIVKGSLKEIYSLNDLFETKEDFEWHKEFGCIERTERLELPTWEELIDIIYGGSFGVQTIKKFDKCKFGYKLQLDGNVYIFVDKGTETLFMGSLTKENYTLACRKCVELFKGEKE